MHVEETDGTFSECRLYRHKSKKRNVVLYFGNGLFEGLDLNYTFENGKLKDDDGQLITYVLLNHFHIFTSVKRISLTIVYSCHKEITPTFECERNDGRKLSESFSHFHVSTTIKRISLTIVYSNSTHTGTQVQEIRTCTWKSIQQKNCGLVSTSGFDEKRFGEAWTKLECHP